MANEAQENSIPPEPPSTSEARGEVAGTPEKVTPPLQRVEQAVRRVTPPQPQVMVMHVKSVPQNHVAAEDRRDFFSDAMRETLGPLAGILQRKIDPILAALEAIPDEAERLAQYSLPPALDQPQLRRLPLPQKNTQRPRLRYLRPPGAIEPGAFESNCSRCGKCVEACPADAITLDPKANIAGGYPYIIPSHQPCVVCSDLSCMKSCPTGALKLVDRLQINMGTAHVDHEKCLRHHGEDCTLCVEICPITKDEASPEGDAIVIHAESGKVRVRKNICIGCGLCENRCPTQAITVLPYAKTVDPIIA